MIVSLSCVYEEARKDETALLLESPSHESIFLYSCKISKDNKTGDVLLENVGKGGDYYKEIDGEDLDVFLEHGWRRGVYNVSMKNYKDKLATIEQRIKDILNQHKPEDRNVKNLKILRSSIMNKYISIRTKLNQLNYE